MNFDQFNSDDDNIGLERYESMENAFHSYREIHNYWYFTLFFIINNINKYTIINNMS